MTSEEEEAAEEAAALQQIQRLEELIKSQHVALEQAQCEELELDANRDALKDQAEELILNNTIEADKAQRLEELIKMQNSELSKAQCEELELTEMEDELQIQIKRLNATKDQQTERSERLMGMLESERQDLQKSQNEEKELATSEGQLRAQVETLKTEIAELQERDGEGTMENQKLQQQNDRLKTICLDMQAQVCESQEAIAKLSDAAGKAARLEEVIKSQHVDLEDAQRASIRFKLENKKIVSAIGRLKTQISAAADELVQAKLKAASATDKPAGTATADMIRRVAVLEAENRAKAETLVDFQGEFTTAQEKLLAALAQNQKYEEDLRQSAAETAAREAEDVVVAAQYEKEALDALAKANAAGDDKAIAAAEAKVECARDSLAKEEQEADMAARVAAETEEASLAAQAGISAQQVEAEIEIEHSSPVKSVSPDLDDSEEEANMSDFQKMMAAKMLGC